MVDKSTQAKGVVLDNSSFGDVSASPTKFVKPQYVGRILYAEDENVRAPLSPRHPSGAELLDRTSSQPKRAIIGTNIVTEVGAKWLCVEAVRTLAVLNVLCWKKLHERWWIIVTTWYQITATAYMQCVLSFVLLGSKRNQHFPKIVWAIFSAELVALTGLNTLFVLKLCRLHRHRERSSTLDTMYILLLLCISLFSLYVTYLLLLVGADGAWLLLSGLYLIGLLENLNITLWVLAVPLLVLFGFVESALRLLMCQLRCPRKARILREVVYQTFKYSMLKSAEAKCTVCLADYAATESICALTCHDSHVFHEQCIIEWLHKQDSCPICRQPVQFRSAPASTS